MAKQAIIIDDTWWDLERNASEGVVTVGLDGNGFTVRIRNVSDSSYDILLSDNDLEEIKKLIGQVKRQAARNQDGDSN